MNTYQLMHERSYPALESDTPHEALEQWRNMGYDCPVVVILEGPREEPAKAHVLDDTWITLHLNAEEGFTPCCVWNFSKPRRWFSAHSALDAAKKWMEIETDPRLPCSLHVNFGGIFTDVQVDVGPTYSYGRGSDVERDEWLRETHDPDLHSEEEAKETEEDMRDALREEKHGSLGIFELPPETEFDELRESQARDVLLLLREKWADYRSHQGDLGYLIEEFDAVFNPPLINLAKTGGVGFGDMLAGLEAEELRKRLEELLDNEEEISHLAVRRILDEVDARDSLAWIEEGKKLRAAKDALEELFQTKEKE